MGINRFRRIANLFGYQSHQLATSAASWGFGEGLGTPQEQPKGHPGVWNLAFIDVGWMWGPHLESFPGTFNVFCYVLLCFMHSFVSQWLKSVIKIVSSLIDTMFF